jgi:hypothetical protein
MQRFALYLEMSFSDAETLSTTSSLEVEVGLPMNPNVSGEIRPDLGLLHVQMVFTDIIISPRSSTG